MRHHRQRGCHGDSRSVWAGFLSWPLVKQTSKVGRQSHSLVLTASFTSSTASIAPVPRAWHRPVPPLHGSLPYITAPDGIVMVNLPQSSSNTKRAFLSKHAAARREAVDPTDAGAPVSVTGDTVSQCDGPDQTSQVPKQDREAQSARLRCVFSRKEFDA